MALLRTSRIDFKSIQEETLDLQKIMDILDFIFPKNCLECGKHGKYICDSCVVKVDRATDICPICGTFAFLGRTHESCRKRLGLDGFISLWQYQGVIRKAILGLKYRFAYQIAAELAVLANNELEARNLLFGNAVLVPIPLHPIRERWRGFNQSEEIGKLLSGKMKWEFNSNLLKKEISTEPQVSLTKKERESNVKNVFVLNSLVPNLPARAVEPAQAGNNCLVLFDDVWTTGATVKEACRVLKKAKAREVWGLTLAG